MTGVILDCIDSRPLLSFFLLFRSARCVYFLYEVGVSGRNLDIYFILCRGIENMKSKIVMTKMLYSLK